MFVTDSTALVNILFKKELGKVNLAKRGMFHFVILIICTVSLGVNNETNKGWSCKGL